MIGCGWLRPAKTTHSGSSRWTRRASSAARPLETRDRGRAEVREGAGAGLETVYAAKSPEATLVALNSKHADVRRLGSVRLFQRGLLKDQGVQAALRRRGEDDDPEVRRTE